MSLFFLGGGRGGHHESDDSIVRVPLGDMVYLHVGQAPSAVHVHESLEAHVQVVGYHCQAQRGICEGGNKFMWRCTRRPFVS